MLETLKNLYFVLAYWLGWALFGFGGMLLTLAFLPLLLLPRTEGLARFVRGLIKSLFQTHLTICRFDRTFIVQWRGFDRPLSRKTVFIANHPSLMDAPVLLSRLPDAICVFKPRLLRNPVIGPAALLAGYASAGGGVDAVRATAARVTAGRSLLIFPEGTRTRPGAVVGDLQAGFALIAARAQAPVQLIIIRVTEGITAKGRTWWKLPAVMPARMCVQLDRRWHDTSSISAARLTREVESRMRESLSQQSTPGGNGT